MFLILLASIWHLHCLNLVCLLKCALTNKKLIYTQVGSEQGECTARICPCSDDICQYRLDFSSFVINQPDQSKVTAKVNYFTSSDIILVFNSLFSANVATHNLVHTALNASTKTQCNIDQFSVTAPGSTPPPVVCGTLTGDHSKSCLKSLQSKCYI